MSGTVAGSIAELQAALRRSATERPVERNDRQPALPAWGATPVAVTVGPAVLTPGPPAESTQPVARRLGSEADPITTALRPRRRAGGRRPGSRPGAGPVVAVASLCGGAGVSTLCAGVARVWRSRGWRVAVLDASGPLPGTTPLGDPTGIWRVDGADVSEAIAATWRTTPVATIGGPDVPDVPLLATTCRAARADGAVVLDLGTRRDYLAAAIPALGADLVMICCPARPEALRAAAGYLRVMPDRTGWPPVALAVTGKPARDARPAIAASADVTAGWVRLTRRRAKRGHELITAAADAAARPKEGTLQ